MKAVVEGRTVRLPDFLIVGTARSGTTSLYNYLNQHPQIFMPTLKEPNFFVRGEKPSPHSPPLNSVLITRFDDYLDLFAPAGKDQVVGEASSNYLYWYESSIGNIKEYIPDWNNLKIIIMLREPVERAFSMYSLYKLESRETLSFEEALNEIQERLRNHWGAAFDYVGYGLYYEQVKAFLETFPHVRVYLYDDLRANAPALIRDLFGFLEVDDSFVPETSEKHNPSGEPLSRPLLELLGRPDLISSVFPPMKLIPLEARIKITKKLQRLNIRKGKGGMKEETRRYLRDLYREDVLKLQELIGRDLSGWLR